MQHKIGSSQATVQGAVYGSIDEEYQGFNFREGSLEVASADRKYPPWIVSAVLFLVVTGFVAFFSSAKSAVFLTKQPSNMFTSSSLLNISITNVDYGVPPSQSMLPWDFLVEPYRVQTAKLDLSIVSGDSVIWDIAGSTYSGSQISFTITSVGVYDCSITVTDSENLITNSKDFTLAVKYIRREVRSLTDSDRGNFFDTLQMLYSIDQETGENLYGSKYRSAEYLLHKHLNGAGTTDCDHWHDGAGIITHHAAFTLECEQSLQSIDPSIAMPYWEYPLDASIYDDYNWVSSPIFNSDWFGEASPSNDNHAISTGRWEGVALPNGEEYRDWDVGTTGSLNPFVNGYGLLRSPWNNNPSPYIGRSNASYSTYSSLSALGRCSCSAMSECYASGTLAEMNDCMNGYTHGVIHILIGGAWGEGDEFATPGPTPLPGAPTLLPTVTPSASTPTTLSSTSAIATAQKSSGAFFGDQMSKLYITSKPSPSPVTSVTLKPSVPSTSVTEAETDGAFAPVESESSLTNGYGVGSTTTAKPTRSPAATHAPSAKPTRSPDATHSPSDKPTRSPDATHSPSDKPTRSPDATHTPTEGFKFSSSSTAEKPTRSPDATHSPTLGPDSVPSPSPKPTRSPDATHFPTIEPTTPSHRLLQNLIAGNTRGLATSKGGSSTATSSSSSASGSIATSKSGASGSTGSNSKSSSSSNSKSSSSSNSKSSSSSSTSKSSGSEKSASGVSSSGKSSSSSSSKGKSSSSSSSKGGSESTGSSSTVTVKSSGASGASSTLGSSSETSSTGVKGVTSDNVATSGGSTGSTGSTVSAGSTGSTVSAGSTGSTVSTGSTGSAGSTGSTVSAGSTGSTVLAGSTGSTVSGVDIPITTDPTILLDGPVSVGPDGPVVDMVVSTDDSTIAFLQGNKKLLLFKMLWRMGWTRCPETCDSDDDCDCSVPQEYLDTYGAKYMLETSGVLNAAGQFISDDATDEEYEEILEIIQDPGVAGEMFSSAAPYDPTFWPLHGSIERLLGLKRIQLAKGEITSADFDETWGYTTSNYLYLVGICDWSGVSGVTDLTIPTCNMSSAAVCPGHREDDVLEWDNFLGTGDTYTNAELYEFIHPFNEELPYVYDDFSYDYCYDYYDDLEF